MMQFDCSGLNKLYSRNTKQYSPAEVFKENFHYVFKSTNAFSNEVFHSPK